MRKLWLLVFGLLAAFNGVAAAADPKIEIDAGTGESARAWYTNPLWIGIGIVGLLMVIVLVAMAARGGGTREVHHHHD